MLGIVGSSFFTKEEGKVEYNGFSFMRVNDQWLLKGGGQDYYFQYMPRDLENLTSPGEIELDIPNNLGVAKIYLGFQPKDEINADKVINLLGYVFYNNYGIVPQKACTIERDCPDIPIINCDEKTGIIIISGEENSYTRDEKCLIMTATDNQELEKLTERLIYNLLGIMN
jgi:hypothetical protein